MILQAWPVRRPLFVDGGSQHSSRQEPASGSVATFGNNSGAGCVALAENASGAFAVAWAGGGNSSPGGGVYGQYFNADGSANGASFAFRQADGSTLLNVQVALSASGVLVVAWNEASAQAHAVYASLIGPQ